jgi:hypothetical protein
MADGAKLGQQAITMPSGNTASRPASPEIGDVRYNTQTDALENFTAQGWLKVATPTPTISSVSGIIYASLPNNLVLSGINFGASAQGTASFTSGATSATATATPNGSGTSVTVAVPAAIYGLGAGTSVSMTWTNADGGVSAAYQFTVQGIPTGGTITTSGLTRTHVFNSSGTFTVPSGLTLSATVLIVGGGGAGGYSVGDTDTGKGGGGAGGVLFANPLSIPANSYSIVVGNGGAGQASGPNNPGAPNGQNSTGFGVTANGGGGGGSPDGQPNNGGANGGSGGGAACRGNNETRGQTNQPSFSGWQAFGSQGGDATTDDRGGGGGGGAGARGTDQNGNQQGGAGGAGVNFGTSFSGITFGSPSGWVGGGGGGGSYAAGSLPAQGVGGQGGGGNGTSARESSNVSGQNGAGQQYIVTNINGIANTGGGGGGSSEDGQDSNGINAPGGSTSGAGGSGVVLIRYTLS